MKSRFFSRKDEFVLTTITALLVVGLCYQGFNSLINGREHAVFQKSVVVTKK